MVWWTVAMSLAADVGVPLDPMSSLPWEVAATEICGATTTYDGDIVMYRWWVRDDAGRLVKIVHQQVGRESLSEERFAYDAQGRLATAEEWEWRPPADEVDPTYRRLWVADGWRTSYVRDQAGRLVGLRKDYDDPRKRPETWAHEPSARAEEATWSADRLSASETLGGTTVRWTFDERGVPLTVSGVTNGRPEVETWHRDCAGFPPVPERDPSVEPVAPFDPARIAIPYDPPAALPWEPVAPADICGATRSVDGVITTWRWWLREEDGRLARVVHQDAGATGSVDEEYFYRADGKLIYVIRKDPFVRENVVRADDGQVLTSGQATSADPRRVRTLRDPAVATSITWAPGRRSATVVPAGSAPIVWSFDEQGGPVELRGTVDGHVEVETWHRDCTSFPPLEGVDAPPHPRGND